MTLERSNFRFLPSEEARLILGYLQNLGLEKTTDSFLEECDSLSEFRSLGKRRRNSSLPLLGISLTDIFDGYYQSNYGRTPLFIYNHPFMITNLGEETEQNRVAICFSKSIQTECMGNSGVGMQTDWVGEMTMATQTDRLGERNMGTQTEGRVGLGQEDTEHVSTQTSQVNRSETNWPDFTAKSQNISSYVDNTPNWIVRPTEDRRMTEISHFLENTDTFDLSSRLGAGLVGSRRKSLEPRKSLVSGEQLSDSYHSGDFPNFTGELMNTVELCVDDFMSTLGNETILNNILGIKKTDNPDETGFTSPTPSPVNPRRVSLLECTPSPAKRANGSTKGLAKQRSTPLSFNLPDVNQSAQLLMQKRSSAAPLPFAPPQNVSAIPEEQPMPRAFTSRKRRTPYQKKTPKRKSNNSTQSVLHSEEFCNSALDENDI